MAELTYKDQQFYIDGKKFTLYSGAIHYFRCPSAYWYDRLLKLKECGFNTVETYLAWNLHEPKEGEFDFSGELDFGRFLDIAAELGLKAIVRPGPFICAEWENGGLPAWLLAYKDIQLRCYNAIFLEKTRNFFKKAFEIIRPRLLSNGGNVIMLQVENEYGSYGNDHNYMRALADTYKELGADCLYFTSDGIVLSLMKAGTLEDCLCFVNFGSQTEQRMELLKEYRPSQPLVCAEFWGGWFTAWYNKRVTRAEKEIKEEISQFLKNGYGLNYYMFHGGTNFGFMNGALVLDDGKFKAVTTSYDDYALLNEAGDRTENYYAVRNAFIENGLEVPKLTAKESKKIAYGQVRLTQSADLFESLKNIGTAQESITPLRMEDCGQNYGYILYSTEIEQTAPEYEYALRIDGLADRAIIFVDGKKKGVYERGREITPIVLEENGGKPLRLDVFVENMGRINYGPYLGEKKGIGAVRLSLQKFYHWTNTSLPMDNLEKLEFQPVQKENTDKPTFFKGEFYVDEVADTFLKTTGFEKGFVVINGFNIGRYFNSAGPQNTLYVPAPIVKQGKNEIIVFESDETKQPIVEFVDKPEWQEEF
ncbi:MAG: beta-galactosidase [Clostridia bacterium]|nr:beta-galactosidase [Clostridia bacterium]